MLFGTHTRVQGWVRGLGKARLQRLGERGWQTVAPIHAGPNGHFTVSVRALRSTQLRLAYNGLAGDAVPMTVTPRVTLRADGRTLRVLVSPRLPLQVQRLTQNAWRPVARTTGSFKRSLKPGSYRVKVLGGVGYSPGRVALRRRSLARERTPGRPTPRGLRVESTQAASPQSVHKLVRRPQTWEDAAHRRIRSARRFICCLRSRQAR